MEGRYPRGAGWTSCHVYYRPKGGGRRGAENGTVVLGIYRSKGTAEHDCGIPFFRSCLLVFHFLFPLMGMG